MAKDKKRKILNYKIRRRDEMTLRLIYNGRVEKVYLLSVK